MCIRDRAEVGAIVEAPAAYGHVSGRKNLALFDAAGPGGSRRTRRRRIEEALETVGLAGVGKRPVKAYSLGMRQRLGLAAALLRRPRLLVLDRGRLVIQDALSALRQETGRVLVRTPDAAAAVALLDGRITARDGDRLMVTAPDAALLNSQLVTAGMRIAELRSEVRSLEDVVLEVTGPGSDRLA